MYFWILDILWAEKIMKVQYLSLTKNLKEISQLFPFMNRLANFFIKVANINCRFNIFGTSWKLCLKTNLNVKYFSDSRNRKSDKNCQTQDKVFTFRFKNLTLLSMVLLYILSKLYNNKFKSRFRFKSYLQTDFVSFTKHKGSLIEKKY